ncbi:glutathione peroxidase [Aestuariibacter sp. AA17]|uniref:Glutathione peroxidase n=1 Tax=Fluctibacter corallii TaxID=2984329 RepID=A0ABT3A9J9_9ALTE|nr:glutathione peroxidase [Aestuariibacter sp. AA17]MCV2885357.1 glutathione peroxidase [Aestuariibacter sp. AA17]
MNNTIYQYSLPLGNGQEQPLDEYQNQVLLIVNTASKCGFTPQYKGLQALYEKFNERGFSVLAFPCDQFGHQEPGSDDEIAQFCSMNYDTSFPIFKKIDVNGDDAAPLYEHLKKAAPGLLGSKAIKWNFTKFLVNRDGQVVKRYAPTTKPEDIEKDIDNLL